MSEARHSSSNGMFRSHRRNYPPPEKLERRVGDVPQPTNTARDGPTSCSRMEDDDSDSGWAAQLAARLDAREAGRPVRQLSPEHALFAAVKRGDHEALKQAIADGADVCAPEHAERDRGHIRRGATALHFAAERDDCKALLLLINAAASDSSHYPKLSSHPKDPEFGNGHMWEISPEGWGEPVPMSQTSPA